MHVVLRIHKPSLSWLLVQGKRIRVKDDLNNPGNILGGSSNFVDHFNRILPKMEGVSALLVRVLPNLEGPGSKKHHLYTELIKSMVLYGSSIWDDTSLRMALKFYCEHKVRRVFALLVLIALTRMTWC